jgi:hypothetical protein
MFLRSLQCLVTPFEALSDNRVVSTLNEVMLKIDSLQLLCQARHLVTIYVFILFSISISFAQVTDSATKTTENTTIAPTAVATNSSLLNSSTETTTLNFTLNSPDDAIVESIYNKDVAYRTLIVIVALSGIVVVYFMAKKAIWY